MCVQSGQLSPWRQAPEKNKFHACHSTSYSFLSTSKKGTHGIATPMVWVLVKFIAISMVAILVSSHALKYITSQEETQMNPLTLCCPVQNI